MLLHDSINKSPVYTLSFDESLNKVTQECEVDLIIRIWDDDNMVKVWYLGSSFCAHSTAKDLMTQLMTQEVTNKLAPEKLYQISMDGPKVNWSFTGKCKQSALKVFTIHLLIWALVVCTLCVVLLHLVLKAHPGASKTS